MYNYTHTHESSAENIMIGVIMILTATIGIAVNFAVILMIIRTSSFHNAFGYICFSHLTAASAALLTGVIWTGPITILNSDEFVTFSFLGSRFGQLMHLFWFVCMFCYLQVAINRLIAVAWPFAYNRLFTGRSLVYFIGSAWILSFLQVLPQFWYDCWVWFDVKTISWIDRVTACSSITHIVQLYDTTIMCLLILSINTCTFYFIRKKMKVLRQSGGSLSKQQMVQMKRNISLYMQGCVSTVLVMLATSLSSLIPPLTSTKLQLAIANCVSWELILTSYSIILVIFNKPFRKIFHPRLILRKTTTNNE